MKAVVAHVLACCCNSILMKMKAPKIRCFSCRKWRPVNDPREAVERPWHNERTV